MLYLLKNIFNDMGMNQAKKMAEKEYEMIIKALSIATTTNRGDRDFKKVSKETGLSSQWLSVFLNNGVVDAGFKRLFVLRHWLFMNNFLTNSEESHSGLFFSEIPSHEERVA